MAVFSIEGKLGTGKTKFAVWRAQQALKEGRRVASNVDLVLEHLVPGVACHYLRIPDKPSASDLEAIGHGNPESYDEDRNGVLILDELGTWLNSRSFQDKTRAHVIDWLIHARKLGWDVYLIVQDANMIDRQVREALIEYSCRCLRLDKVKLPFVGGFLSDIGGALMGVKGKRIGYMPRMHLVAARVGTGTNVFVAERWFYRGDDLHAAYDTRQVFRADYPHGVHAVFQRAKPKPVPAWQQALARMLAARRQRPALKPKLPAIAAAMRLPSDRRVQAAQVILG